MRPFARTRRVRVVGVAVVAAVGATLTLAVGLGSAATTSKPYSATVDVTSVPAGSTQTVLLTITNQTNQGLGSAEVTVPAGWKLVGFGSATASGRQWTSSASPTTPNTVRLLARTNGDKLVTGESVSVQITAGVPCSGGGSTWGVAVKQSNNFLGAGNDFYLPGGPPATAVTGSCHLAFNPGPTASTAGSGLGIKVELQDGANQPLADSTTQVTIAPGAGTPSLFTSADPSATSLTSLGRQAANGVATFGDVSIHTAGSGYTITASASGYGSITSSSFAVAPAAAHHLTFGQQPSGVRAGVAMSPAVTVRAYDVYGNLVNNASTTIVLGIGTNPASGTLSGGGSQSTTTGIATYSGLSIDKAGNGYTLVASSTGLAGDTSSSFNVTPGWAVSMSIDTIASPQQQGTAFGVTVRTYDAFGNVGAPFQNSTALTLTSSACDPTCADTTGSLGGTTSQSVAAGAVPVAFTGVTYAAVQNNVTITATAVPSVGSNLLATSNLFDVAEIVVPVAAASTPTSGSTCLAGRDKTNAQNPTCVTVKLPSGLSSVATLSEQACNPLLTDCIGSLIDIVGDLLAGGSLPAYSATNPIEAIIELDKSIAGNQGVPHIEVWAAPSGAPGAPFARVPGCATRGVVNPEPICLDDQHRQNDGDSELHVLFIGDPRLATK